MRLPGVTLDAAQYDERIMDWSDLPSNNRRKTLAWIGLIVAVIAIWFLLTRGQRTGQAELTELQSITADRIDHAVLIHVGRLSEPGSGVTVDDAERLESLAAALRSLTIWVPNHPHATEQWTLSVVLKDGRSFEMDLDVTASDPNLAHVYGTHPSAGGTAFRYRAQSAELLRWVRSIDAARPDGV